MIEIRCGDGRHPWAVSDITHEGRTRVQFRCQAPDYFRDERDNEPQGWVKSPWTEASITFNDGDATATLVLIGDHLRDETNNGRQVWQACVYQRGNETLVVNFEPDGGIWYCRMQWK